MSYASIDQIRMYLPQVPAGVSEDAVLQLALDNATDTVRTTMRSLLADGAFDYLAFGAAATKIVRGYDTQYLRLPPYQAGSVSLVEWQTGANPAAYQPIADEWIEESGRLYRAVGWGSSGTYGGPPRYRITAIWGYGATVPQSIVEVTLELAVNIYRTRDKGGFSDVANIEDTGQVTQVTGLTRLQKQVLTAERDQLIMLGV